MFNGHVTIGIGLSLDVRMSRDARMSRDTIDVAIYVGMFRPIHAVFLIRNRL